MKKRLLFSVFIFFTINRILADTPITLETPIILPSPPCVPYVCHSQPCSFPIEPYCKGEKPVKPYNFLGGFYITGQYAYSSNHISNIQNVSPPGGALTPTIAKNNVSETTHSPNIAIGYQFWIDPFLNPRIEIAYLPRLNLNYDANPFLPGADSSINSSIDSHVTLFKLYNDFIFEDYPLIPYIEAGIGRVHTQVNANSSLNLFPGILPPFVGSSSDSRSTRAWDFGFGARYRFYKSLFLNFGYEYVFLGDDLKWDIVYSNPIIILNPPIAINLRSGNFTSHTFLLGFTWEPFVQR